MILKDYIEYLKQFSQDAKVYIRDTSVINEERPLVKNDLLLMDYSEYMFPRYGHERILYIGKEE